ncbi:MAG: hypothetical protein J7K00_04820 [Candidatus Diapherotrites archaeon]|nr:hypothetical protein [Candidatus Diapherotrites archaeon]
MMKPKQVFLVVALAFFAAGLLAGFALEQGVLFEVPLNITSDQLLVAVLLGTVAPFVSAMLFFGYFSFVPSFFFGQAVGKLMQENPQAAAQTFFPVFIALFAGAYLGLELHADLRGKSNTNKPVKIAFALLAVSALAAAVPFFL